MGSEQLDYAMVLADMEAKRAALDAAIANLRIFLSGAGAGLASSVPASSGAPIPNGEIPAGVFLGKSIPEAASLYLQIMKRKATSREIADALKKGGMESTSSNFQGIVHAVLDRYRKAGGEIVKLDRSTWGLASWYPSGVRATVQEKRPIGRKRPKAKAAKKVPGVRGLKSSTASPKSFPEPFPSESLKPTGLDDQIEQLLLSDKAKIFSSQEIIAKLQTNSGKVNFALGRLEHKKKAERAPGGYRAFSGHP
jgi:hypothetical protein